ncbi:MAG: tRNA (guanosine(37)-N1)-methyltransferase TrmD [Desulfarculus sp.]|nr:MAG: tRNA (guanosine(37)-N1)-methyltransferase TrmD [Desulfarculus sp.]
MIFDILTLLPEVCRAYLKASILGRAQQAGLITVRLVNVRESAMDRHRTVDDAPYGGGDGMVMKVEPLVAALESLPNLPRPRIILLSPAGRPLTQELAAELAGLERLVLICGRYEGVDERVRLLAVDQEISLGDFVLSGGELPALALVEAVSRLVPGVLGGEGSAAADSFSDGLLEHPHYTRPPEFRGLAVPEVLLSGNHAAIARWRRKESLRRTWRRRPELLAGRELGPEDQRLLAEVQAEEAGQPPPGGSGKLNDMR